ncbi:hypothetical protein [Carboxylicivirga sp. N1Y90]|uniref:hypothetical protein n=1 Tax=Carboxylicivirga fragile TaxID=3417571 RepID=UPI003D358002|nr:hypothetical protein [Marinilabiliaceae bacterium N1Y90]
MLFVLSEDDCLECIEKQLNILKKVQKIEVAHDVIVLARASNIRKVYNFVENNNIKVPVYGIQNDNKIIDIEIEGIPCALAIENGVIANFFSFDLKEDLVFKMIGNQCTLN